MVATVSTITDHAVADAGPGGVHCDSAGMWLRMRAVYCISCESWVLAIARVALRIRALMNQSLSCAQSVRVVCGRSLYIYHIAAVLSDCMGMLYFLRRCSEHKYRLYHGSFLKCDAYTTIFIYASCRRPRATSPLRSADAAHSQNRHQRQQIHRLRHEEGQYQMTGSAWAISWLHQNRMWWQQI